MRGRSSALQMVGFTVVLLFAVGLLLTGLGVFGVPSVNDFRDWDKYHEKHDALWAEWEVLNAEFNSIKPSDPDAILTMFSDPANAAKMEAWLTKFKTWQKRMDKWQRKSDKLDRQYPPELVSKYAPYRRYDR